ncbi:MAG: hypothetical protein HY922_09235 [Elusimicrobia bacterium]|nr:hypothetical protein [Elusimicrobiota bacterium]
MKIRVIDCMEWTAPNKPGMLLRQAVVFKKMNVDLDVLMSNGRMKSICASAKKPAKLKPAIKDMGIEPRVTKRFHITGKDKTGALVDILRKLASGKVNVEGCTALAAEGKFGTILWVKPKDLAKARKLLKA